MSGFLALRQAQIHDEETQSASSHSTRSRKSSSTFAHDHKNKTQQDILNLAFGSLKTTAETKDSFEVSWDGPDDPENPQNWSRLSRWYYTLVAAILVFNATFASSAPSGVAIQLQKQFTVSPEVETLIISLFVAGYCVGPIIWGPLSEHIGRRYVFMVSFAIHIGMQAGCALSENTASILVFRFLSGCTAASPLANSGALIADIWDAKTRGQALGVFTVAPFAGPALGPVVGGFIDVTGTSWRWLFLVLTIFAGCCLTIVTFTLPETYTPVILYHKAQRKRKATGDDRYHAPIEKRQRSLLREAEVIFGKPFKMLAYEPMLAAVTIYMSFVYGCIYLLFESYPVVFGPEGHNFNPGVQGLMFLPVLGGGVVGSLLAAFYYNNRYIKKVEICAPKRVPPEYRLRMCVVGGILFAVGFFWMGWTSYRWISFWAPTMSGLFVGCGVVLVFQGNFNFIIDTYLKESATALSANTIVRSLFGAGFPLFAAQLYNKLGPRWASTLLGCIALIMIPIPLLFMRYGHILRARSRYTPDNS